MFHTSSGPSQHLTYFTGDDVAMVPETQAQSAPVQNKYSVNDIVAEGVALVASLRSNSSLPSKVVPEIVSSFNQITECTVDYLREQVLGPLKEEPAVSTQTFNKIEQSLEYVRKPLEFLSSKYKQDEYFTSHPLFVSAETLPVGFRYDVRNMQNKLVYDTYEYISIEKNLRSLLQNKDYVDLLVNCKSDYESEPVIREFSDGERYHNHFLFGDGDKFSIQIQLFFDGMGTTNPLRGQSSTCNVGVFYYTILNLPHIHNSCFANVHLLALCNMLDIKVHGYRPVLERFVAEINHLQRVGFSGTFPVIGSKQVYVGLAQVSCDNLALNGLFGFIECFSADFFCTICLATQSDIQSKTRESEYCIRTRASYEADVANTMSITAGHSHGVKMPCLLNDIDGFHVTENFVIDPMHTLLEGVVPCELYCILSQLVNVKCYFSIADLNSRMHSFFDRNSVDKGNRPPTISPLQTSSSVLSPSMKAVQMWSLLRYLPVFMGNLVPGDDPHWIFLLHLCEL